MSRRRRIASNRFLPQYVSSFRDRHGKTRLRFRHTGMIVGYFTAPLGTEAFRQEYRRFNDPEVSATGVRQTAGLEIARGSVADLKQQYYSVPERLGPTLTTQQKVMSVLYRGFFIGREDRPVAIVEFDHIDAIISTRRTRFKNEETGRWEGGVEAARKLRKELVRLFAFAEKEEVDREVANETCGAREGGAGGAVAGISQLE